MSAPLIRNVHLHPSPIRSSKTIRRERVHLAPNFNPHQQHKKPATSSKVAGFLLSKISAALSASAAQGALHH